MGNEVIGRMIPPANNLTLTNTTLVGNYQASSTITAETNVVVNGTATLKTPGTIYLKPGFTANSGCKLTISVGAVTSDKYYYLKDHLGSIRVVVDTVGEIVSYSDYDPCGMILNGRSSNYGFADDKYKFTGKERDTETNYDYFGARYYDSRLGRWLQVDPLAEKYPGWSPYNYALNNPLIIIDPNGKDTTSVNSQIEYDSNSGKETVTETIIDEKGDDDNPNGPTTRTTTNVAVINPDGTISVTSTTVQNNTKDPYAHTVKQSSGGVELLTSVAAKVVNMSSEFMKNTGMGYCQNLAMIYDVTRSRQAQKETYFNIVMIAISPFNMSSKANTIVSTAGHVLGLSSIHDFGKNSSLTGYNTNLVLKFRNWNK